MFLSSYEIWQETSVIVTIISHFQGTASYITY